MGFFNEIIRNSKRPVGHRAVEGAARVTPAAMGLPPGLGDSRRPVAQEDSSLPASNEVPQTLWEEEVGRSGAALTGVPPSEPEDRQVVGPSPSENTEDSDLARAPESSRSSPVIGKRKQAGLKNRRDGIVHPRMNRDRNLHGVASFGEVVYRLKDSSVVKPLSKRPEQGTRGKSVEAAHRSRQAGQSARAGATTPPFPPAVDGAAAIPIHSSPEPGDHPPAPEDVRSASAAITRPFETAVPEPETIRSKRPVSGKRRATPAVHEASAGIESEAVPSGPPAAGTIGDAVQAAGRPLSPAEAVALPSQADIPLPRPMEVSSSDTAVPESFPASPRETPISQAAARPPVHEPDNPKVHIGLLEVVVLAPEKAPDRKRSLSPDGQNFASRHYLRNF